MCGICGIYHSDPGRRVNRDILKDMAERLRHRGPDDEGFYVDGNLGLGHRRLSIIDLSTSGRQPMPNEDERYWIVHNGEIYNYPELRQGLLARGHRFRSHTDTEVILHLFEEEGEECVRRLNGMFAFAVWDTRKRQLFAARDRLGVKPFYYVRSQDGFFFASEIKALVASGLWKPEIDRTSLADYVTFQFCLGSKTLFKGVEKLAPGHSLTVSADGTVSVREYWRLQFDIDMAPSEDDFRERLAELLKDAVRLRLRADVPVGAHLSGGLDSSTVTCLAAALLGDPIKTFSGGFREGPQYDETSYARLVSRAAGTEHHEVFPTADEFVTLMPELMYFMDEPVAGPGLFPQYIVSRLASQKVKVVLGGQGGDEVFGGYARYLIAYLEQCVKGAIAGVQEEEKYVVTFKSILPNLRQLEGYEPLLRQFWSEGALGPDDRRYFRLIDRSGSHRYFTPGLLPAQSEYDPYESYREIFHSGGCKSLINKMTWFDQKTLLPALLHVEDRTSMAVSLESRVPLLDYRIIELAAMMPPKVKYKGGRSKHIFREAVRQVIPAEIYARTDKMGFPVPLNRWVREKPVRDFVREVLLGPESRRRGMIDCPAVENLLETEADFGRQVWGLLCLELWCRKFAL